MRIVLTSILCQSGLMTHVHGLARHLATQGEYVAIAFKRTNYLDSSAQQGILTTLGEVPYLIYDTAAELRTFLLESGCTLVHAHSHATFDDATQVSLALDIPLVVTLHSVFPWHRRFRLTLQTARKIIAVGPAQARSARAFRARMVIIQNGIDTDFFRPNEELADKSDTVNVLWYGRVDGRLSRGLKVLDRLVPMLPSTINVTGLGIAHPPPRSFPMLPWTDNPLPHLQKSHITFAHGRSLREAMSCGSIGMLLGYGYGGRVTEARLKGGLVLDAFPEYRLPRPRVHHLLHDILEIADHSNLAGLRKEARTIALENFDIKDMVDAVQAVYCDALARSCGGTSSLIS